MNTRFASAKLFLAFAALNFALGAVLIARDGMAREYSRTLLAWAFVPNLLPMSEGIVSAVFGLFYLSLESTLKRKVSVRLSLAQLILMFVGFGGHFVMSRFWWRVLVIGQPSPPPLPIWSVMLSITAFSLSFLALALNIFVGGRISNRLA